MFLGWPPGTILSTDRGLGTTGLVVKGRSCWHVISSSPVPLKTRRVRERCTLNLSRAQTSSQSVVIGNRRLKFPWTRNCLHARNEYSIVRSPIHRITGMGVCSIWMPVDPVPRETCVQFVAGSHKWGWFNPIKFETTLPYQVEDKDFNDRTYQPVPDIEANKDTYDILSWELQVINF
ncbi:uncharacterized protein TNCV_1839101 [Trichonephila clavipes]|nr:uncharacterized protein TNCV_1839101 [Trichonephila clavipes]